VNGRGNGVLELGGDQSRRPGRALVDCFKLPLEETLKVLAPGGLVGGPAAPAAAGGVVGGAAVSVSGWRGFMASDARRALWPNDSAPIWIAWARGFSRISWANCIRAAYTRLRPARRSCHQPR